VEPLAQELLKRATQDPEPRLREQALAELCELSRELAAEACRAALKDPEPRVRLTAASALPADPQVEGVLAELATSWAVEPELRMEAFDRYLTVAERPLSVMERALADPVLAERAVYATSRFAEPGWLDLLAEVFADCDAQLKAAIAIVFSDLGHAKAEELLLEVPQASGVAERLAEIGTARAIPVLKRIGTMQSIEAIARIRERAGDLAGHVALVEPEDRSGALSEVDAGRLSLDED
jgi:HEAT repeat protein